MNFILRIKKGKAVLMTRGIENHMAFALANTISIPIIWVRIIPETLIIVLYFDFIKASKYIE
jgi:hypothetical protein